MSRCYPFPPLGYEKKNAIADVDVLAKEKHKEKKHKKDKDREKKDGKVKKDKDRSKESKDKKDRREKHKHRKDRKDKSQDSENSHGTSNDKKPAVHLTSVYGARNTSGVLRTENHNSGNPNHIEELARRIRIEGQATGSQIVHKNTATNGEKVDGTINNLLVSEKRTVEKEKNALGGPILPNVRLANQAKVQMHNKTNDRNGYVLREPNQTRNLRQVDDRKIDGAMEKNMVGGQLVQKTKLVDQEKVMMHTRRTDDGNGSFVRQPYGKEKGTQVDGRKVSDTMDPSHSQVLEKRNLAIETNGPGGHVHKIKLLDQGKVGKHARTNDGNCCFVRQPNGEEKGTQVNGRKVSGTMDSSHLQVLVKRNSAKETNGLGGQVVQKIGLIDMDQGKVGMHVRTDEGNDCFAPDSNRKEKGTQIDGRMVNDAMHSSHLQVSEKRNLAEEKFGLRGKIVQKVRLVDQAKVQLHTRTDDGNGCYRSEPNGKEKGTQVGARTVNGGIHFVEAMSTDNVVANRKMVKPSDTKGFGIDSEGTDKIKSNGENNYKMDMQKSKDRNKNGELNDKVGDKKKKEEKAKEKGEISNGQSKVTKVGSEQNDIYDADIKENGQSKAFTGKILAGEGVLGKRKEREKNGFLHENGSRPHKLQKPVASSPANPQNGSKDEVCQMKKLSTDSDVAGLKNGMIEAPKCKVSSKSPLRPPHPDSVLLDQILSLPKMDRTPEFDDQEWLFCNTHPRESLKISELDSSERQMVWNNGTRIESADIFALPYVIPF